MHDKRQSSEQTNSFSLTINGRLVQVADVPTSRTLLDFLREQGLTGTKLGCAEGDCGACTVALVERDNSGRPCYRTLNSCIALLPMFAGREILTVEALEGCHPVQEAMIRHGGSQCGFCTPGFIMSMFEGHGRADVCEPWQIADQLCGNLCRCTGYRPIRDAAAEVFRSRSEGGKFREQLEHASVAIPQLEYDAAGFSFLRPDRLDQLLALKQSHPETVLVAGATEIGVVINKQRAQFPLLISTEGVEELRAVRSTPEAWYIGGAATLTAIEEALAGELPSFDKMLRVFASRQIRNRATLAGNLATASPIGDTAPVLLTLDATLVLASAKGERTIQLEEFFTGYRSTAMAKDEIIKEIVVPRTGPASGLSRRVDFLKVSKRRELDISIVAAAFRMDCDATGVVREARISFGGVSPRQMRAHRAEEALTGRTLEEAADAVAAILTEDYSPISDVRGSAEYRRALIEGLWRKFVSGETSAAQDGDLVFKESEPWGGARPEQALAHESAAGHVSGAAQYVDDVAHRRPMLEAWPVMSPHAHARIILRDATKAREMPGVTAILMAEDVPGLNDVGVTRADEPLLADREVSYHGHMVAIVLGETIEACRAAAAEVRVEYEKLPHVLGIAEAIAQGSFHPEPVGPPGGRLMRRGDVAAALTAAPHTLEGELFIGGQEHFYLETQAAWAEMTDDHGVFVCSSTQHPSEIQTIVSQVLALPKSKVVVEAPRMGGGFGGKETQGNSFAAIVALGALRTGRPVRMQLDRDIDMILTGKRHPFFGRFQVGFDDEGHLLAVRTDLVSDGGWSLDLSHAVLDRALFHSDNAYYIPNIEVAGRVAKTHTASNTAFRGFGGPQGMIVTEEIMDRVARELNLPPELVRERNLYHGTGETNTTPYGQEIGDNRILTLWHGLKESARLETRRREIVEWNTTHRMIKRGIAITPVKFGISFTVSHYNQAGALVLVFQDGTVQVNHGGTEMGQGLYTKILGIAMTELGLAADRIRVMKTRTDKVPNTSATAASSGSDLNGAAVQDACVTLRSRLAPVAARLLAEKLGAEVSADSVIFANGSVSAAGHAASIPFIDVVKKAYFERVQLSATGFYKTPNLHWDWNVCKGHPFHYFACGAAVSEVEVDGYSGMNRVLRVDILHDVGDSLNFGADRGQIEGGFVQGMGWLTREQLKWDGEGRLLSHGASTYAIPAFSDAPVEFNVQLLPNAAQDGVVHGSKAVGEPPLMLAFSVREAIRDAIAAFGNPGGQVLLASPATNEAILAVIRQRQTTASTLP